MVVLRRILQRKHNLYMLHTRHHRIIYYTFHETAATHRIDLCAPTETFPNTNHAALIYTGWLVQCYIYAMVGTGPWPTMSMWLYCDGREVAFNVWSLAH